jgi:ABC-type sulfate transport system substrate-binding protein
MKTKVKRFVKTVATGLALVQGLILLPVTTLAATGKKADDSHARYKLIFSADVSKILSVFENRIEDPQLLERTKDKLLTLDQRQIRLIASLSDRVAKEGNTTGSDIAFLLMTALITLI